MAKKDYATDIEHTYRLIESSKYRNISDIKHNHNVHLLKSYISSYIEELLDGTPDSLFSSPEIDTLKGLKESGSTKEAEQLVASVVLGKKIDIDLLFRRTDGIDKKIREEIEPNVNAAVDYFTNDTNVMEIPNCNSQNKQGIIKEIQLRFYRTSRIPIKGITKNQFISEPNLIAIDENNIPNGLIPGDTFCVYCSGPDKSDEYKSEEYDSEKYNSEKYNSAGYIAVKLQDTTKNGGNPHLNSNERVTEKKNLIRIAELRADLLKELGTTKTKDSFLELYYKIRDYWHGVGVDFMEPSDDMVTCINEMKRLYNNDNDKFTAMTHRLLERFDGLPMDKVMYVRRLLS